MKRNSLMWVVASIATVSCGEKQAVPFTQMLADRFDAPACRNVQVLRMGGERVPQGHRAFREFVAEPDCLSEIEREIRELDFEETNEGQFVARRDRGWVETVILNPQSENSQANVIWEEINP